MRPLAGALRLLWFAPMTEALICRHDLDAAACCLSPNPLHQMAEARTHSQTHQHHFANHLPNIPKTLTLFWTTEEPRGRVQPCRR
ncbi:hypothetical protein F5X68DRAFT_196404 [Plectosphaerella plurivora]|uniref:Secreted protein n=1 Tax=Plectosphaerella plurivora TaxID=936078 RepID=A0A9P9AFD4_9PEZI|nr:hypothetical protein F5X68DRAFT_196404 [Plectosphaerella plurivora]